MSDAPTTDTDIGVSRSAAFILLAMYIQYLFFQLYTHPELFAEEDSDDEDGEEEVAAASDGFWPSNPKAKLSFPFAAAMLMFIAGLVSLNSELLVGVIEDVTKDCWMSDVFVGVILLPIVGNAAEHMTAVTAAYKNKLNLSLGIAIGSATQMAGFVTPVMVLLGWAMGKDMGLDFHPFAFCVLLISVLVVAAVMKDGRTSWLQGALLMSAYVCIAIGFALVTPTDPNDHGAGDQNSTTTSTLFNSSGVEEASLNSSVISPLVPSALFGTGKDDAELLRAAHLIP